MLSVFDRRTPRFTASQCRLRTHEHCQERQSTEAGARGTQQNLGSYPLSPFATSLTASVYAPAEPWALGL